MELSRMRITRIPLILSLVLGAAIMVKGLIRPAAADPTAEPVMFIQEFIASIGDGRVGDAMAMMSPGLLSDPETRESWRHQFAAIRSIALVDVSELKSPIAGPCLTYKVRLEVHLTPEAALAPIPNYGWDDNPNIRWIELCPGSKREWMISSIGSGP